MSEWKKLEKSAEKGPTSFLIRIVVILFIVGAVGVISVASHWVGRQMGEMIDAFEKGDVSTARRINAGLLDSYDYESSPDAVNPVPTKTMLRVLGLKVGSCRPPMGPAPDDLEDRARRVLDGLA